MNRKTLQDCTERGECLVDDEDIASALAARLAKEYKPADDDLEGRARIGILSYLHSRVSTHFIGNNLKSTATVQCILDAAAADMGWERR